MGACCDIYHQPFFSAGGNLPFWQVSRLLLRSIKTPPFLLYIPAHLSETFFGAHHLMPFELLKVVRVLNLLSFPEGV